MGCFEKFYFEIGRGWLFRLLKWLRCLFFPLVILQPFSDILFITCSVCDKKKKKLLMCQQFQSKLCSVSLKTAGKPSVRTQILIGEKKCNYIHCDNKQGNADNHFYCIIL